jgi:hypothetical protein
MQEAPQETVPAAEAPAPAADREDDDAGEHGSGHGLGNTHCQSLKGTGGPAFGHCIAAKAHALHGHGKHR